MHRMNKPLIRFFQSEQVQKHQQERVRNPANRLQQPPLPILAGNGESQRQQQQSENPPPFTGRRRREQGMCEGNYEHKAQQQHSGKRDLLIKLIAEVPLPVTDGGQQASGKLKEAVILRGQPAAALLVEIVGLLYLLVLDESIGR